MVNTFNNDMKQYNCISPFPSFSSLVVSTSQNISSSQAPFAAWQVFHSPSSWVLVAPQGLVSPPSAVAPLSSRGKQGPPLAPPTLATAPLPLLGSLGSLPAVRVLAPAGLALLEGVTGTPLGLAA